MWVFVLLGLVAGSAEADKSEELLHRMDLDGVVSLNVTEYAYFVVNSPRPYTLVLLFSTTATRQKCPNCKGTGDSFRSIAYSYQYSKAQNCSNPYVKPVFFAKIDSLPLVQAHDFHALPIIAVTHPLSVLFNTTHYLMPKEDMWELAFTSIPTHKVLDFINSRTGYSVELVYTPYQVAMGLLKWLAVAFTLTLALITLRKAISSPKFMVFAGMVVYFLCISGTIYIIINGSPLFGRKGSPEFIHKNVKSIQTRHQYAAEGYYIGTMVLLGALGLISINSLSKMESG